MYGPPMNSAAIICSPIATPNTPNTFFSKDRLGSTMFGKHAPHDIFVDLDAKGVSDLLGDADTTGHNRTSDCGASS